MDFDKRGDWNKRGGWKIFMKSINVEEDFFLWRVEFFKIGKRDFMFSREMRVSFSAANFLIAPLTNE
jgi:hypothetical protein